MRAGIVSSQVNPVDMKTEGRKAVEFFGRLQID